MNRKRTQHIMMKFNSRVPLVSHVANCRCRGANKRQTTVLTKLSEDSTLGQESIPRVNSLITETTRVILGLGQLAKEEKRRK